MADFAVTEGNPLILNQFLVTAAGVPITEQSVSLKFIRIIEGDYEFYTGEGWSDISSTVPYEESNEVPGLYRYTIPAADLPIGDYIAITTAPTLGAIAENVSVFSRKMTRKVTVL